ncbi:MAG: Bax inhibitor-1/YccA family protein [Flavobacteriales bacterium]|nr:Bax inhibitor-1/YccA family protein [Flavobacteriales bacterium]
MALIERSSNPAFSDKIFDKAMAGTWDEKMTVQGTVNKSLILFVTMLVPALYVWNLYYSGTSTTGLMLLGGIGGFIAALVTIFKPTSAAISAPIYAALEGLFLGGISAMFESSYPGIVMQAVGLTFGTMFVMLFGYRSGLIKVTEKFKAGVFAATGAVAFVYFLSFIFSMFGGSMPMIHEGGLMGIGFSLVVIVIAALNLVMDFDFIYKNAVTGAPKYMEWFSAFGLMITLVWLYLEFLRLLSKLNRE